MERQINMDRQIDREIDRQKKKDCAVEEDPTFLWCCRVIGCQTTSNFSLQFNLEGSMNKKVIFSDKLNEHILKLSQLP